MDVIAMIKRRSWGNALLMIKISAGVHLDTHQNLRMMTNSRLLVYQLVLENSVPFSGFEVGGFCDNNGMQHDDLYSTTILGRHNGTTWDHIPGFQKHG
jgi:hypothetical protein